LPFVSICAGESLEVEDSTFFTSGEKFVFTRGLDSCLTLYRVELEVRDPIDTLLTEQICIEDLPFAIWDTTVIETSTFSRIFTAADGCDSTVFVDLTVFPLIDTLLFDTLCAEGTFPIGDTVFNTTGTHVYTFEESSFLGCDTLPRGCITNRSVNSNTRFLTRYGYSG